MPPQKYEQQKADTESSHLYGYGFSEEDIARANSLMNLLNTNEPQPFEVTQLLLNAGAAMPKVINAAAHLSDNRDELLERVALQAETSISELAISGYKSSHEPINGPESARILCQLIRWGAGLDTVPELRLEQTATDLIRGLMTEEVSSSQSEQERAFRTLTVIYDLCYSCALQEELTDIIKCHEFVSSILCTILQTYAVEGEQFFQIARGAENRFEEIYSAVTSQIKKPGRTQRQQTTFRKGKKSPANTQKQQTGRVGNHILTPEELTFWIKPKAFQLQQLFNEQAHIFRGVLASHHSPEGIFGRPYDILIAVVQYYNMINSYGGGLRDTATEIVNKLGASMPSCLTFYSKLLMIPVEMSSDLNDRISVLRMPPYQSPRYFENPIHLTRNPELLTALFIQRFGRGPERAELQTLQTLLTQDLSVIDAAFSHRAAVLNSLRQINILNQSNAEGELRARHILSELLTVLSPLKLVEHGRQKTIEDSLRIVQLRKAIEVGLTGISAVGERFDTRNNRNKVLTAHGIKTLTLLPRNHVDQALVPDARYRLQLDIERTDFEGRKVNCPPAQFLIDDKMQIWYVDDKGTVINIETSLPNKAAFRRLVYEFLAALSYDSASQDIVRERQRVGAPELSLLEDGTSSGIIASHYRITPMLKNKGHKDWFPMNEKQWEIFSADPTKSLYEWRLKTAAYIERGMDPSKYFLNYISGHTGKGTKLQPRERELLKNF